jgi:hypothetical protein
MLVLVHQRLGHNTEKQRVIIRSAVLLLRDYMEWRATAERLVQFTHEFTLFY